MPFGACFKMQHIPCIGFWGIDLTKNPPTDCFHCPATIFDLPPGRFYLTAPPDFSY